jgi:hypothetical protein
MKDDLVEDEGNRLLAAHMALLQPGLQVQTRHEVVTTPVFTNSVLQKFKNQFSQYGFMAGMSDVLEKIPDSTSTPEDPRIFFNIAAPSSAFICGSQGSGKSHTLSCLLEHCLMQSDVSILKKPLSGLVFHYDTFTSDVRGIPCEAVYLSSNSRIKFECYVHQPTFRQLRQAVPPVSSVHC